MFNKRDILIFLAGALAFHGISHLIITFSGMIPFTLFGITVGQTLNTVAIVASLVLAAALLYLANKEK